MLGILKGISGGHRGDWWWNGEVQVKVEAKKTVYANLVESKKVEAKRARKEMYKATVRLAKMIAFKCLYEELGDKGGVKKLYRLANARERNARDVDQVKCIKDEDGRGLVEEALIRQRW